MNAIPEAELEGCDREKALERVLYSLKGQPIPAVNLMEQIGMVFEIKADTAGKWAVVPHTAFVEFYWLLRRAADFFHGHGLALRFGGSPLSDVGLEIPLPSKRT
jgi:hypothetical protein